MTSDAHLNELGEFLKERGAESSPRTVGLPESGAPRRVRGLRREEVARLAGLGTDCYARLERGRVPVSRQVLARLVRVLHLDDAARDHLFALAAQGDRVPRRRPAQKVQPQLKRLPDELPATPALVLGRHMDILAWRRALTRRSRTPSASGPLPRTPADAIRRTKGNRVLRSTR